MGAGVCLDVQFLGVELLGRKVYVILILVVCRGLRQRSEQPASPQHPQAAPALLSQAER